MKILHFINDFRMGGHDTYVNNILAKSTHNNQIIKPGERSYISKELIYFEKNNVIKFIFSTLCNFFILVLRRKTFNNAIFHIHGSINIFPLLYCILFRKKCIYHKHESSKIYAAIFKFFSFFNFFYRNVSFVSVIQEKNYIYFPPMVEYIDVKPLHHKHNKIYDEFNVLMVCNVNPIKNLYYIDKTFSDFPKNKIINVYIYGSIYESQKKYHESVVKKYNDIENINIFFMGWSKPQSIIEMYHEYDFLLCNSKSEGSPTSILELMRVNQFIVSKDVGNVANMLKDYDNSLIFNENINYERFYDRLNKLSNIRNNSIDFFYTKHQIKKLDHLYNTIYIKK